MYLTIMFFILACKNKKNRGPFNNKIIIISLLHAKKMFLTKIIVDCLIIDQWNSTVYYTYEFVGDIMNNSVSQFSVHENIFVPFNYLV